MAVLIMQKKLVDGKVVHARCDARCYDPNVKHPDCVCPCGGVNHGLGYQKALLKTQEIAGRLRREAAGLGVELSFPTHEQGWYLGWEEVPEPVLDLDGHAIVDAFAGDPRKSLMTTWRVGGPYERKKDAMAHLPYTPTNRRRIFPGVYEYTGVTWELVGSNIPGGPINSPVTKNFLVVHRPRWHADVNWNVR